MLLWIKSLIERARYHQGFRRYLSNTSWVLAEQLLRMITGLFVGIWVARYLGPAQFGLFSYAVAFAALFGSIAKLGLDQIVIRELIGDVARRDVYLGTAFWLRMLGALVMLAFVYVAMQLTSSDTITKVYIIIIASGAIFQSFEVIDFYFQSKVLSKFVSICKLIQLFMSSLLKLYLIAANAELYWFVMVSLVDQLILAVALYIAYRRQKAGSYFGFFDLVVAKKLLKDSWPLMLSGLVIMIYMRIDQIMIKEMLGEAEVGIYSAATRISEVWYFIPMLIANSLFPAILNAKKTSEELYHFRLQRMFTFLVWISIAVALLMTVLSDTLVLFLYGTAYKEAGPVLMTHIWAGVFVAMGVASSSWFINENLQRYAFYRTTLGALVNVALNLIFIPAYGIVGAALATVIAQLMAALLFDLFTSKTRAIFWMKVRTLRFAGLFR